MDTKEANICTDTTVGGFFKSTSTISQTTSDKYLKITELTEYCKVAEDYLNECKGKVQMLTLSKNENEKLRAEYVTRNKINMTNFESLMQVKNELYKYKCELKLDYITTQRTIRARRLKYHRLMSSYESEWQGTLEQYNANPIVLELVQIQEENFALEKEIEKLEKLKHLTEIEFLEVQKNTQQNFLKEVIDFSKTMVEYNKCLDEAKKLREKRSATDIKPSAFNFYRTEIPALNIKNAQENFANEESNCLSGIDVSVFDDVAVPDESLEVQNDEELLPFFGNDSIQEENAADKSQPEGMDIDYEEPEPECQNGTENQIEGRKFATTSAEVSESQYFKTQEQQVNLERAKDWGVNSDGVLVNSKNKEFDEREQQMGKSKANENKEQFSMKTAKETFKQENEENLSDGSFENQYNFQSQHLDNKHQAAPQFNENFECHYNRSSETSDDTSQHANETTESPKEKSNGDFLAKTGEKKDFSSFGGFFNMGNETNSPKPSIFKLF